MSRDLVELDAYVVFKNPLPGERKKLVKASFQTSFRTVSKCKQDILKWARGQYQSATGLAVDVFKPDLRNPHYRAELLRDGEVLAHISLTPRSSAPVDGTKEMF
ncbi:hypothetical protein [Arthrobacter sp. lap29]|uniref:hypothetical protein n=1 Tax=Arthrobacter sp. lap29 TaxID=3056122 RepID=UPI0028F6EFD0|nr:hypothetical protein [Arthrobacter sp. lap29]